jgi:chorismate synthase
MSSQLGTFFTIATFGESHGPAVGVVVDGCPSGLHIAEPDIQIDLDRRRPGQSRMTTARRETDRVSILSGVFEGRTTGTPIAMMVENTDQRPQDYAELKDVYRPSHAGLTYDLKYGFHDYRGGGRSSARETIGRVAGGAVARKLLREVCGTEILAYVTQIGHVDASVDPMTVAIDDVERSLVRCPDPEASTQMEAAIDGARTDGDSLGGVVQLVVKAPPPGIGEPVFHKVEAELARAMLSLPATKGFEIGSGFAGTRLHGSEHNDAFIVKGGRIGTESNRSGGVQGGITDGEPIVCRVAFKPTATIRKAQRTVTRTGDAVTLEAKGRHDPCVLPRAVVLVEAMAALVIADLFLQHRARAGAIPIADSATASTTSRRKGHLTGGSPQETS